MKFIRLTIILNLLYISLVMAGDHGAAFLDIKVDARAVAMGGAYTALSADAFATFWNPAGLGEISGIQVGMSSIYHQGNKWDGTSNLFGNHYFLSVAAPVKKIGTFSIAWKNYSIGDIVGRNNSGERTGEIFEDTENAVYLGYGQALIPNVLLVGIGYKVVKQEISASSGYSCSGAGFGLGMKYFFTPGFAIGFNFDDEFQLKWNINDTGFDKVPMKTRVGMVYKLFNNRLIFAVDVIQTKNWPLRAGFGLEYKLPVFAQTSPDLMKGMAIRSGMEDLYLGLSNSYENINFKQNRNLAFGLGFFWQEANWQVSLDYAFGMYRLGNQHRISLILGH